RGAVAAAEDEARLAHARKHRVAGRVLEETLYTGIGLLVVRDGVLRIRLQLRALLRRTRGLLVLRERCLWNHEARESQCELESDCSSFHGYPPVSGTGVKSGTTATAIQRTGNRRTSIDRRPARHQNRCMISRNVVRNMLAVFACLAGSTAWAQTAEG